MSFIFRMRLVFFYLISALSADLGDVVHTIPAPGYYSNGLAFDGENLWVANIAEASHPNDYWYRIFKISPVDGTILSQIPTAPWFFHGLSFDGEYLWGEHNYTVLTKMNTYGTVLQQLSIPPLSIGLAIDRVQGLIYIATTQPGMILVMDAASGLIIDELFPQESSPNGWGDLAFDGTWLWHTNLADELIYKIDPMNGEILLEFPAPSGQCEGLTFDGQYLWASDTNLDLIYQIDIELQPPGPCDELLIGDSNLDGNINIQDIIMLVNYILGGSITDECQLTTMDVNADGNYDILDVVALVAIILG